VLIDRLGRLHLFRPPVENLVAAKLIRDTGGWAEDVSDEEIATLSSQVSSARGAASEAKSSLDLALRATRAGGRVVLSGMPSTGADLSPAWFRELEVAGTYAARGEDFTTAFELAAASPLDGVVAGRYPLHRWREALDHAQSAGRLGSVKICFDVRSTS
jgi:threonine dehydrogenase-like Zn-dependent dehydrogenase